MPSNDLRLGILADFLDTVPPEKFDLKDWYISGDVDFEHGPSPYNCGTTACAIGWATAIPEFQAAGFAIYLDNPLFIDHGLLNEAQFTGWDAVERFFGLTYTEAQVLFSASYYNLADIRDPVAVAERLREFVAQETEQRRKEWVGLIVKTDWSR